MPRLSRIGILADMLKNIESGKWPSGSKLPSSANLAVWYGVSETTINWAMSILLREKVVIGVAGQGRYVAGAPPMEKTIDLVREDPGPSNSG